MDELDVKKALKRGSDAELVRLLRSGLLTTGQERRIVRKFVERNQALSMGNSLSFNGIHGQDGSNEIYRKYFTRIIVHLAIMVLPVVVGLFAIGDVPMSDFTSGQWVAFSVMIVVAVLFGTPAMIFAIKARSILFSNTAAWLKKD
jgi:hypothetical protein